MFKKIALLAGAGALAVGALTAPVAMAKPVKGCEAEYAAAVDAGLKSTAAIKAYPGKLAELKATYDNKVAALKADDKDGKSAAEKEYNEGVRSARLAKLTAIQATANADTAYFQCVDRVNVKPADVDCSTIFNIMNHFKAVVSVANTSIKEAQGLLAEANGVVLKSDLNDQIAALKKGLDKGTKAYDSARAKFVQCFNGENGKKLGGDKKVVKQQSNGKLANTATAGDSSSAAVALLAAFAVLSGAGVVATRRFNA